MAEETQVSLSIMQMEAIVKALENSGINSGNYQTMLACYGNSEHINAAKSVRTLLRGKGHKAVSRQVVSTSTDVTRELTKPDAFEELRQKNRNLASELKEQHAIRERACEQLAAAKQHLETGNYKEAENALACAIDEVRLDADDLSWWL